jgi:hypothetical protein
MCLQLRVYEMKLKLLRKQLENVNVLFSSYDFLHKDGSVNVALLSVCAVEITDTLAENLK